MNDFLYRVHMHKTIPKRTAAVNVFVGIENPPSGCTCRLESPMFEKKELIATSKRRYEGGILQETNSNE